MAKEVMTDEISAIRKTFKGLRKARGYTQADISDEIVSKSLISKFENGTSMLAADKLLHVIAKLNMTPNEFVNVLNDYQPDRMQKLYNTLNQIRFSGLQGVKRSEKLIIEETTDKFEILSNIMIKSVLQDVTEKQYVSLVERNIVGDYLNGLDNWTEFEVKLLYYACPILDRGDFKWFGELLLERTKHFYSGSLKNLFVGTLMNLYDGVLEYQELDDAVFFRDKISQFDFGGDLIAIVNFQMLTDLHDYIENPTKENLIKVENYLDKVDALGGELKVIIEYSRTRLKGLKLAKHPNTQCSQK
ncbi:Rgg family transcriptional regulator [Pseudolactococcus laudensis]|uniref:helix-turn-helix domain-containing protein n=1 Tax=Pseudolactococcus laudensis TaxID=1494461 RepID=UPI003F96F11F